MKKYKDVRLNTIERNLQGEEAIAYLEYVSRELGDVILIERLKIAGYFVTDRNKIGFNKKTSKNTIFIFNYGFCQKNFYTFFPKSNLSNTI